MAWQEMLSVPGGAVLFVLRWNPGVVLGWWRLGLVGLLTV